LIDPHLLISVVCEVGGKAGFSLIFQLIISVRIKQALILQIKHQG